MRTVLWQWGSFITDTILKRKYESKKSIKFETIYVSRWLCHEIRNELDIIIIHAHFLRNLKTSNLKTSFS